MLVLTRKYQEKVRIGDGITITILRTKGKAVRLGIEAPADVPVIRGELTFHDSPAQVAEIAADKTAGEPDRCHASRAQRQPRLDTAWNKDAQPRAAQRARDSQPTADVSLQRVPRNQVGEMLPQLVSGQGPLREMLNLRAGTV